MIEFKLILLQDKEHEEDRVKLVEYLTENPFNAGERFDEVEHYRHLHYIADKFYHHCVWYGGDEVYLWHQALGPDPIKAFVEEEKEE